MMKRKSYKRLDFRHYVDKNKSKYDIHVRIELRVCEKNLLRNR
jgi:hypothetical protein